MLNAGISDTLSLSPLLLILFLHCDFRSVARERLATPPTRASSRAPTRLALVTMTEIGRF